MSSMTETGLALAEARHHPSPFDGAAAEEMRATLDRIRTLMDERRARAAARGRKQPLRRAQGPRRARADYYNPAERD